MLTFVCPLPPNFFPLCFKVTHLKQITSWRKTVKLNNNVQFLLPLTWFVLYLLCYLTQSFPYYHTCLNLHGYAHVYIHIDFPYQLSRAQEHSLPSIILTLINYHFIIKKIYKVNVFLINLHYIFEGIKFDFHCISFREI